jgi:hypothetical protein
MQQSLLTVEMLLYALLAAQALTLGLLAWLFLRTRRVAERLPDDPNEQIDKLQAIVLAGLAGHALVPEPVLGGLWMSYRLGRAGVRARRNRETMRRCLLCRIEALHRKARLSIAASSDDA